jgi:hypothetical protein
MWRYALIVVVVLLSLMTTLAAVARSAFARETYVDPFAPYGAIAPGAPASVLTNFNCRPTDVYDRRARRSLYCEYIPKQGHIVLITASVSEGTVSTVTFMFREVYVDDLVWRLGDPDLIRRRSGIYVLGWGKHSFALLRTPREFTARTRVAYVTRSLRECVPFTS